MTKRATLMVLAAVGLAVACLGVGSIVKRGDARRPGGEATALRGTPGDGAWNGEIPLEQGAPPPDGFGGGQEPPPDGPGGGPGGPPPGGGKYTLAGAYQLVNGEVKTESGRTFTSDKKDVSGVYAANGAELTLTNCKILTTGNTSSNDNSSFHGLNAGVLADKGAKLTLDRCVIDTKGSGANGLFAAGKGSVAVMKGGSIKASGPGGHAAMATKGGRITLVNVDMETVEQRGAPVATDRGGGTVDVTGGKIKSAGYGSPGIYSTGAVSCSGSEFLSTGAEAAVIEGQNTITLTDCTLVGSKLCGVMLYQSFSGDAQGRVGTFTMRGGSLTAKAGPLFYVTNAKGVIKLSGVKAAAESGVLVKAGSNRWGRQGSNGGQAVLYASGQRLTGDLVVESGSSISATLTDGSVLTGVVTGASLDLDTASRWIVTGDSALASFKGPVSQITGNGHTVTYDAKDDANSWLGGKSYNLTGGGVLKPK